MPSFLPGCYNNANCFLTPLFLLSCHNVNRLLPLFFSCTVVIFPLSYRILYRVDGAEIKNIITTTAAIAAIVIVIRSAANMYYTFF